MGKVESVKDSVEQWTKEIEECELPVFTLYSYYIAGLIGPVLIVLYFATGVSLLMDVFVTMVGAILAMKYMTAWWYWVALWVMRVIRKPRGVI